MPAIAPVKDKASVAIILSKEPTPLAAWRALSSNSSLPLFSIVSFTVDAKIDTAPTAKSFTAPTFANTSGDTKDPAKPFAPAK